MRGAVKRPLRHHETRRHGWVWDGRGNSGHNARHCYVAPGAADDDTLTRLQLRLLLIIGRFCGWVELDQGALAEHLGVGRRAVNVALRGLVERGHLDQRSQAEAGEARCQYRVATGAAVKAAAEPAGRTPVCPNETHPCDLQEHRGVIPTITPPQAPVYSSRADLDISDETRSDPPVVPQPSAGGRRPLSTYLASDWQPSEADRAWAIQEAPHMVGNLEAITAAFRDRHAGRRRADWAAAWRDWWRGACSRATRGSTGRTQRRAEFAAAMGWSAAVGGTRALSGGIVLGHGDRGHGVHDQSEPWVVYRERMIREGLYRPQAASADG